MATVIKQGMTAAGASIVADIGTISTTVAASYAPQVTQILQAKPDCLTMIVYDDVGDQFAVRQADGRVGVDPLLAHPFHLGAPFVVFGDRHARGIVGLLVPVLAVFAKWGLDASIVGIVTADDTMRITHHGELVAEIPNKALTDDAPVYNRPVGTWKAPVPLDPPDRIVRRGVAELGPVVRAEGAE